MEVKLTPLGCDELCTLLSEKAAWAQRSADSSGAGGRSAVTEAALVAAAAAAEEEEEKVTYEI